MCIIKRVIAILIIFCCVITSSVLVVNAEAGDTIDKKVGDGGTATGVGLATWAMLAYSEGWQYVWGGSSYGAVDCSGLMLAYRGVTGNRVDCWGAAKNEGLPNGYLANDHNESSYSSIPRIHGLGLHAPGHVGVYLGSFVTLTKPLNSWGQDQGVEKTGIEIDARDSDTNCHMKLDKMGVHNWDGWYMVVGVSYPEKGFVQFNGQYFYYEPNGKGYSEYVVSCTRTIGGKKYTFDDNGVCQQKVSAVELAKTKLSTTFTSTVITGSGVGNTNISAETTDTGDTEIQDGNTARYSNGDYVAPDEVVYEEVSRVAADRKLKYSEERRIDELNKRIYNYREEEKWNIVYVILAFIGILVLTYSLLLVILYYFDLFNSFTEVSLLHKATFGRMYPVGSAKNIEHLNLGKGEKNITYVTHAKIWTTFSIGVIASALFLNMRFIVVSFIRLSVWFQDLITHIGG